MASKANYSAGAPRRVRALAERQAEIERVEREVTPLHPRHNSPARVARKLLWETARRARVLSKVELHDPQWMMLLELFVAAEEQREVNVKMLCLVSHVPSTTAARHIAHLEKQGMVRRMQHPADGRSFHFALTPRARDRIRIYLDELDREWLRPAPPLVHH